MKIALGIAGILLGCTMLVGCGEGMGHHGQFAKSPEVSTTQLTSAEVAAPAPKQAARPVSADTYTGEPAATRQLHLLDRNDPYASEPTPLNVKRWMADRTDPYTGEQLDTRRPKIDPASPFESK